MTIADLIKRSPSHEILEVEDKMFLVVYVVPQEIAPAFGVAYTGNGLALVRNDLCGPIRKFIREHELYHLRDPWKWGGWVGKEIRANFAGGVKYPLGLLLTTFATIGSWERIKFYLHRIKKRY